MEHRTLNYRYAEEIFESRNFHEIRFEIFDIINRCPVPALSIPKTRKRGKKTMVFTTDQGALNRHFDKEFTSRGWEYHPDITGDGKTKLQADFKKQRVQVEVQFGNMARWYTDVFKMQVSYSLGRIDVGVLVLPMQEFANTIDENVAHFERVERELPYAKMSITLPILVVGIAPKLTTQPGLRQKNARHPRDSRRSKDSLGSQQIAP